MKLNKKKITGNSMVVNAVATTTTTTTTTALSGEEVCVPPVTVAESDKFDAGNLSLSSCASKKHVCINSNNKEKTFTSTSSSAYSFQKQTGVCYDI